ncbi:T9SS type A sorting domain-containing protein [Chryseobacterium sp.]|uniref:T9SS type A sorting domain-containing protein n=1 Tax=Chryseobacterium sp. TaxID=1871047 RepID=UPI0016262CE4|nr:T9SS type A sorting domain-containing protein [Chryseobacterium sp.]
MGANINVNSYCSFTPGGSFHTLQGNTKYDFNSNGCDTTDPVKAFQKFTITNGTVTGSIIGNNSGNYSIPVQAGTHTITPILENPTFWSISPNVLTVNFPTQTSPLTQNFCVTANGNHNDLEVMVIPVTPAAPGFNAKYKILFKNKGTATQSGSVVFNYNDNLMNFSTATVAPGSQSTGTLNWNFTNLLPFETREITLTFALNTPTATPPLNGNDVLHFTSQINGLTDETPPDNTFALNQTVVNSFDPNDKTCLQGTAITQTQVGDYVHYLIRFENTGTANAQNIVVKDEIDLTKFDINSIVALNGSHSFVTRITSPNVVEFIFENIQLPFNNATNDGFVAFKIKTKSTLNTGDSFSNLAKIYFDYNAPIVTNTYTTTVQALLATAETATENFSIYPNPVKDMLYFKTNEKIVKLEIFDVSGRIISSIGIKGNSADLSGLAKGHYLIKAYTKDRIIVKKLIKE